MNGGTGYRGAEQKNTRITPLHDKRILSFFYRYLPHTYILTYLLYLIIRAYFTVCNLYPHAHRALQHPFPRTSLPPRQVQATPPYGVSLGPIVDDFAVSWPAAPSVYRPALQSVIPCPFPFGRYRKRKAGDERAAADIHDCRVPSFGRERAMLQCMYIHAGPAVFRCPPTCSTKHVLEIDARLVLPCSHDSCHTR